MDGLERRRRWSHYGRPSRIGPFPLLALGYRRFGLIGAVMNERANRILRGLGWAFYALAAAAGGIFILDLADLWPGGNAAIASLGKNIGSTIFFVLLSLFSILLVALAWEFARRQGAVGATRADLGAVVMSLGQTNPIARFAPVVGTLVLVVLMNMLVFAPDQFSLQRESIGFGEVAVFGFFYVAGHFLLLVFALRALRDRPYFVLTQRGFLYEPGDLSPGLVRWEDISGVKETQLLYGPGSYAGPSTQTALVVTLKDGKAYAQAYNPLLRALLALLLPAVRYQAGGSGDIVLRAADFDARYEEVKGLIGRHVRVEG